MCLGNWKIDILMRVMVERENFYRERMRDDCLYHVVTLSDDSDEHVIHISHGNFIG